MPGMSGIQLIHTLRKQYAYMQFALMTAYNVDDYVRIAREEGIYHIIPKSVFLDLGFFSTLARKLLSGNYFGIEHYFPNIKQKELHLSDIHKLHKVLPEPQLELNMYYKCRIASTDENRIINERVSELLLAHQASPHIPLVLEELCANALRYSEKCAYFELCFGLLNENTVITVIDYDGKLDREQVLLHIERHITLDSSSGLPIGLEDLRGRGLYISREQCEHLIFNIHPKHKTEIIGIIRPKQIGYNHAISIFQKQ